MHSEICLPCLVQAEKKLLPPSELPCGSSNVHCHACAEAEPVNSRHESTSSRVAVVDATPRTRGIAYRAIRKLGRVPVTFVNTAELRAYCCREGRFGTSFEAMLIACPPDTTACRQLIAEVRSVLGHRIPLIWSTSKNQLREIAILEAGVADAVVLTPASFEDMCGLLDSFLTTRDLPFLQAH